MLRLRSAQNTMFTKLFNRAGRSAKRREELRRTLPRPVSGLRTMLGKWEFWRLGVVLAVFVVSVSSIVAWSRSHVKVSVGQIMTDTRVNRLDFAILDVARTEQERLKARERSPEVYILNQEYLNSLREPLVNLPTIVAGQQELEAIDPKVRADFALDAAALQVLSGYADETGQPTEAWKTMVDRLLFAELPRTPLLDSGEWQQKLNRPTLPELRGTVPASWQNAIRVKFDAPAELVKAIAPVATNAGFPASVTPYVASRIAADARPTYLLDSVTTAAMANRAMAETPDVTVAYSKGQLIYARGDVLTAPQLQNLTEEAAKYRRQGPMLERWTQFAGLMGLVSLASVFMTGYMRVFYRRITTNPFRLLAIVLMMATLLMATVVGTERMPVLMPLLSASSVLLVSILLLLAYDQRLAIFVGAVQCLLTTLALEQSAAWGLLLASGCGAAVVPLREIRHRSVMMRAATVAALVLGLGSVVVGLLEVPLVDGVWRQLSNAALLMVGACYGTAFTILGILPSFEKAFDITTGLTLVELRDPRHPLLKQLQQKAPGTYNHSLQIANIAEAAAEAIGANGLLVYVGALYHDIGKMNKPEYFVENQSGVNKHEKLRPELSLLIIINHVKDGIELSREYGLPRAVRHFIESHHGTTLVQFFYHSACAKAEATGDEDMTPDETEFRYPGPKPQTKEAAILMISDAVESATRAMAEPTPSRIEGLVHELARCRLEDGQFDECNLTLKELTLIEESIVKSVCAIYHGRIAYPSSAGDSGSKTGSAARPASMRV